MTEVRYPELPVGGTPVPIVNYATIASTIDPDQMIVHLDYLQALDATEQAELHAALAHI